MVSLQKDIQQIENIIHEFDHKIEELHRKVRLYILDKKKYPRPNYEYEIARITEYQIPNIRNKVLDVLLDNVKYKARLRSRVWRRWLEEDAQKTMHAEYSSVNREDVP